MKYEFTPGDFAGYISTTDSGSDGTAELWICQVSQDYSTEVVAGPVNLPVISGRLINEGLAAFGFNRRSARGFHSPEYMEHSEPGDYIFPASIGV